MLITLTRRNLLFGGVALALHQNKIDDALRLVEAKASTGEVAAAAVEVQHGDTVIRKAFGKAETPDAVFLLASITKPMTCTAAMILSDRKELSIEDPVQKYLPEFKGGGRDRHAGAPPVDPLIGSYRICCRRMKISANVMRR